MSQRRFWALISVFQLRFDDVDMWHIDFSRSYGCSSTFYHNNNQYIALEMFASVNIYLSAMGD